MINTMSECPYCKDYEDFFIVLNDGVCDVCGYIEDDYYV